MGGELPRELMLAAVACAARGEVLGVPVQRLREDTIGRTLNLDDRIRDLGVFAAALFRLMLPAATSLRELRIDGHALPIHELMGTKPTEKIDLSGTSSVRGVASAIIIASCIKGNRVLKELNLRGNNLFGRVRLGCTFFGRSEYTAEGIIKLCGALKGSAVTSLECAAAPRVSSPIDTSPLLSSR